MSINTTPTAPVTVNGEPLVKYRTLLTRVVSSAKAMKVKKTSRQNSVKPAVLSPSCRTFGSLTSTPPKQR